MEMMGTEDGRRWSNTAPVCKYRDRDMRRLPLIQFSPDLLVKSPSLQQLTPVYIEECPAATFSVSQGKKWPTACLQDTDSSVYSADLEEH